MIDLDPTMPHRLARLGLDPTAGRSLGARMIGGLAVTLAGLTLGTVAAVVALYSLAVAVVEYGLWPL